MNYATTNKLLKKGIPRTIVGQITWSVLILALVAPAGYLAGYFKTRDRASNMPYAEIMSQKAQRLPENIEAPETISLLLQPFGQTDVESSFLSGHRIWRAEYEVNRNRSDAQLLAEVARMWRSHGLRVDVKEQTVSGYDADSETLFLGNRNGDEQFMIFAYEKASSDVTEVDAGAMYRANDLPLPPQGAEVVDCSGPGAGNISAFRVSGNYAAQDYMQDMEQMGWTRIESADTAFQLDPNVETLAMMKKGERHATLTTMALPRGEQLISLVIF